MSTELLNLIKKDFKKAKTEAKKLIENGNINLIELDKKILTIREKLMKKGRTVADKITMNDRYVFVANSIIREKQKSPIYISN